MKNIINTLIVISIMTLFAFILTGFIEAKNTTVQQYEFEIVTVIESVVPKGLGRSRMIAKTEDVDYKTATTVRMEEGEKDKSKDDKRKDIRTKAFEETKILNFYNLGGIRFNNVATNDAMVKSKLNQMAADGSRTFVSGGVESSGMKTKWHILITLHF